MRVKELDLQVAIFDVRTPTTQRKGACAKRIVGGHIVVAIFSDSTTVNREREARLVELDPKSEKSTDGYFARYAFKLNIVLTMRAEIDDAFLGIKPDFKTVERVRADALPADFKA